MFTLGSIYLLVILAMSKTKHLVGQLKGDQALRLAALIRCPPPGMFTFNSAFITLLIVVIPLVDTSEGCTVIRTIIPAITKLRSLFDLDMTSIFSYHLLQENGFPMMFKASELRESDRLFDDISYKLVVIQTIIYLIVDIFSVASLSLAIGRPGNHVAYQSQLYQSQLTICL